MEAKTDSSSRRCYRLYLALKDEVICEKEIRDIARADREDVADHQRQMNHLHQCGSDANITHDGDGPAAGIEFEETSQRIHFCLRCIFLPCPLLMPEEIVDDRTFDGEHGGNEVMDVEKLCQNQEQNELNTDAHRADGVEAQPLPDQFEFGVHLIKP